MNGEYGLGIFPLRDDGMCKWGAIDVDIYNLDFEKLEKDLNKLKLPLIICKTKKNKPDYIIGICRNIEIEKNLTTQIQEQNRIFDFISS